MTSRVAAMLMQLFTGQRVGFAASGGGLSGGVFGVAVPVFAGGGVGPGGTPPFLPSGAAGAGWGAMAAGYKGWLARLGNIGYGPKGGDFGGEVAGSYRGVGGSKGGALLLGGSMLAMDGLRRGGWTGAAETAAGGR